MLKGMRRRALRILVLLWLGWYLTGPLAEMVDFWDTPPQEMHDIARGAGGMVALMGTALAIVLSQIRKLRERFRLPALPTRTLIALAIERPLAAVTPGIFLSSHSPPIPLRI
jgi:hypothetical protein